MSEQRATVTSIEELKAASRGSLVQLPPFAEGTEFWAIVKRPSMMGLVKAKKIPNELLTSANALFKQGAGSLNTLDQAMMEKLFGVMEVVCESAFVEPTYRELQDAGIELTDDQYSFIFNYSQEGVKKLEPFRQ